MASNLSTPQSTLPVVRLRRGIVSRLVGDGVFGDLVPSQVALLFALIFFVPFPSLVGWVVVALLALLAFVGVTMSYSLRGSHLVATVCGVAVTVLDVSNASVGVEETLVSRGLRIAVIYVDDAVVLRRIPLGGPRHNRVRLGYSRAIGYDRRQTWRRAIQAASR